MVTLPPALPTHLHPSSFCWHSPPSVAAIWDKYNVGKWLPVAAQTRFVVFRRMRTNYSTYITKSASSFKFTSNSCILRLNLLYVIVRFHSCFETKNRLDRPKTTTVRIVPVQVQRRSGVWQHLNDRTKKPSVTNVRHRSTAFQSWREKKSRWNLHSLLCWRGKELRVHQIAGRRRSKPQRIKNTVLETWNPPSLVLYFTVDCSKVKPRKRILLSNCNNYSIYLPRYELSAEQYYSSKTWEILFAIDSCQTAAHCNTKNASLAFLLFTILSKWLHRFAISPRK